MPALVDHDLVEAAKRWLSRLSRCRWLNTIGLALGIVGVEIIFHWGPPQPDLDPQGKLLLAASVDKTVEQLRNQYEIMSRVGLGLVGLGFVAQLVASWPSGRPARLRG
jgi:hypothetical protein